MPDQQPWESLSRARGAGHAVTRATLRERREDILRIARTHGASNIRVFGSVARGDSREDSDLDLLVLFDPDRSLLDHGALIMDLQDLLGVKVDIVSEQAMRPRFRRQVMQEAVPL